ncbi:low-density lipoprotein receptor-related protein 4-like isoform X2 [Ostrea edulis]|uniref:low-density lipoprotein receptor-related protein 4-like isoform X2 n=1 Tax=Ostrea edulis TaxID=37623 RepID=UPI0024AF5307|nr:low-density lipoprotein receptor-related protein 4-like isoform X2 [Ostrea edulis]
MKVYRAFTLLVWLRISCLHFSKEEKLGIGKMVTVEKNIIRNYNVYRSDNGKIIVRNIAITESAKNISDVTYIDQDLTLHATENEIRLGSIINGQFYFIKIIMHLNKISKVKYDRIHRNIYFVEDMMNIIGVVPYGEHKNTDYTMFRTIVAPGRPIVDIAIEPAMRYIFWIDSKEHPILHRANLRGEEKVDLIFHGLNEPIFLEVSTDNEIIFWHDARKGTVEIANFNGNERRIIHQSNHVYKGLSVFNADEILLFDKKIITILNMNRGTHIDTIEMNGTISNVARYFNGSVAEKACDLECMQFCFSANQKYFCDCYTWYTLYEDAKECIMPDHYRYKGILMILNGKVCTIPLTIDDKPLLNIQCWPDTEISTELTVDETARTVFFVQRIEHVWYIKKKERRYSQIHHLHRSNDKIRGLVHDMITKSLYYGTGRFIKRTANGVVHVIREETNDILFLAIDSEHKMLWCVTSENGAIFVSSLDGSNKRLFVASVGISGLNVFRGIKRLFWTANTDIYSIDYKQSPRVERDLNETVKDLVLFKDILTWTTTKSDVSRMCSGSYIDRNVPPTCLPISGTISALKIFDESVNTNMEMDQCAVNNGGCSEICLPNANEKCVCVFGKVIEKDKKGCKPNDITSPMNYVVDTVTNRVYTLSEEFEFSTSFSSAIIISHIDFDKQRGYLIIFQKQPRSGSIISISNGTELRFPDYQIELGCIDTLSGRIYVAATNLLGESVFAYVYNSTMTLINQTLSNVTDMMCWSSKRFVILATTDSSIQIYLMDTGHITKVDTNFRSTNTRLAHFSEGDKFFALDKGRHQVSEVSLSTKKVMLIFHTENDVILDIDVDENIIHLLCQRYILQVNKSSGNVQRTIPISPMIGKPAYILIHNYKEAKDPEEIQVNGNEKDDLPQSTIIIVFSTIGAIVVVVLAVVGIIVICRKTSCKDFWQRED